MQRYEDVLLNKALNPVWGANIAVMQGVAAALIYDENGAPIANPVTTGTDGEFHFYAPGGVYTLIASGGTPAIDPIASLEIAIPTDELPITGNQNQVYATPDGSSGNAGLRPLTANDLAGIEVGGAEFQTNGTPNTVQDIFNLVDGTNTQVFDNGDGSVYVDVAAFPWGSLTSVPLTFPPSAHTHGVVDITDFPEFQINGAPNTDQSRLNFIDGDNIRITEDGIGSVIFDVLNFPWGSLTGVPLTFAPSAHTHTESDITNLATDLAAKENVANKDTDGTLVANSDTKYASQKATKAYVDAETARATGAESTKVPTTRTVNGHALSADVTVAATDITTGTLPGAQLPTPTTSVFGGVKDLAAVATKFLTSIVAGVPIAGQPAFTDLSGSATAAQMPDLTAANVGWFWGPSGDQNIAGGAGVGIGGANVISGVMFKIANGITVRKVSIRVTNAVNPSTANFAIYTPNGATKLLDASFDTSTTGNKTVTITAVPLTPGWYIYAYAGSSPSIQCVEASVPNIPNFLGVNVPTRGFSGTTNALTGTTMPSSLGTLTASTGATKLLALFEA